MSTHVSPFLRGALPTAASPRVADVEFTHSVNTARDSFEASLREHSVMDAESLSRVLAAFDSSVSDISAAVVARVSHAAAAGALS